jgi:hypothetical protein
MPGASRASIKGRCEAKKKNTCRHDFRQAKYHAHVGCTAANGKRLKLFALATDLLPSLMLRPAYRDAEVYRLER